MDRYGLDIQREITATDEPVSLERLKTFLGIDYTDHDDFLKLYLTQARSEVEKYCGIALISQTITLTVEYWSGSYPLPYPSAVSVTSVKDLSDNVLTYTRIGNRINVEAESGCVIVYTAGAVVSEDAATAVMLIAACLHDKELIPAHKDQIAKLKRDLKQHN